MSLYYGDSTPRCVGEPDTFCRIRGFCSLLTAFVKLWMEIATSPDVKTLSDLKASCEADREANLARDPCDLPREATVEPAAE